MAGVKRFYSEVEVDASPRQVSGAPGEHQHPGGVKEANTPTPNTSHPSSPVPPIQLQPQATDDARAGNSASWRAAATTTQSFEPDASIALIGLRGVGKLTLAIIASTAMNRKILDSEKAFQHATGMSSSAFKKVHGASDCHRKQAEVLRDLLSANEKRSIIVCSWIERQVQSLLRTFCRTNPVVHILREENDVQKHLKIADTAKARSLIGISSAIFRSCSNFEFFNLSEDPSRVRSLDPASGDLPDLEGSPAPYLALKRAERHFLKFLTLVMPAGSIPFIESAFPLQPIPTEERMFTYALSVKLSSLLTSTVEIEDLETGADAIEIVIDDTPFHKITTPDQVTGPALDTHRVSEITRAFGSIRRNTVVPLIYHVQRPPGPQRSPESDAVYMELVLHGLRLAPEYITIDLHLNDNQCSQLAECQLRSKVIGHASPEVGQPWKDPFWVNYYSKARNCRCNLVRLIKPAVRMQDNFDVKHFIATAESLGEPRLPIIAYNSGPLGRHSACFNQILTSVAPNSTALSDGQDTTWPQLTAFDATTVLYSSFVFDPMKLYVFGAQVSYSLSPSMHNAALKATGIQHVYKHFSTPSLSGLKHLIVDTQFAGASVGLPFKVEIISLIDGLSRHAKAIGAVNTLIPVRHLNPDGTMPQDAAFFNCRNRAGPVRALYGENTDWIGIRACIRRGLSPANAVRPTSCGLVIGAGGMARAAVYAMLQLGVKNIVVFNRTVANAEKLVQHFRQLLLRNDLPLLSSTLSTHVGDSKFHVIRSLDEPWPEGYSLPTMIVSCIPTYRIGESPAPDFTLPPSWLGSPTGGVFFELEYKTLDSPLLAQLRKCAPRGWVTMDGLDLLPEQGFAQFELFTGRRAPRRLMRREALKAWTAELGSRSSSSARLEPRMQSIVEQEP